MLSGKFKQLAVAAGLFLAVSPLTSAQSIQESDWYVQLDIQSLQNSQLRESVKPEANEGISIAESLLGEGFVKNTQYLTAFGDIKENNRKTVMARGNYAQSKTDLVKRFADLGLNEVSQIGGVEVYSGMLNELDIEHNSTTSVTTSKDSKVTVIKIQENSPSKFYLNAAFLNDSTLVVSPDKEELSKVISNGTNWNPEKADSLFEVVVDVEKAIVHGGVNVDEASEVVNFESISAKKLKQVSASYREFSGHVEVQVGLLAADTSTATKILSVVQGLLALKVLSENDPVVLNLLNGIQFEQNAESLRLVLSGPVESFKLLMKHANI